MICHGSPTVVIRVVELVVEPKLSSKKGILFEFLRACPSPVNLAQLLAAAIL